jgi:hypothetical protein
MVRVVPGDGRLSLQEAPKGTTFDIIHMDAFSGDGIPTHLLTREALEVYLSCLDTDGLLMFHISNRYYNLRSVLKAAAARLHLAAAMNIPAHFGLRAPYEAASQCVVMARSLKRLQPLLDRGWVALGPDDGLPDFTMWTDDYINILAPLWANIRRHPMKTKQPAHAAAADASRAK